MVVVAAVVLVLVLVLVVVCSVVVGGLLLYIYDIHTVAAVLADVATATRFAVAVLF